MYLSHGGAHLKVAKVLVVLALVAMFASIASADPVDPKITINKGGGSPTTTSGSTRTDPIIVYDGSGTTDWLYEGPSTTTLFVLILPALTPDGPAIFADEIWVCDPGLALSCGSVLSSNPNGIEFAFVAAQGVFVPGLDLQVTVPEPNTLILMLVGALGLGLVAWKRRGAFSTIAA